MAEKYTEGIGRRKTASARVRIVPAAKTSIVINDKPVNEYFKTRELQEKATASLLKIETGKEFVITVKVSGGGVNGQAEAVRHGIARALEDFNKDLRPELKKAGFLTRDSRSKERRKFGLKKARKSPQWSKR